VNCHPCCRSILLPIFPVAHSVDSARAACIEAARKKGDQPIETENVRSLGEGRYEMSVRNKGTLGSSVSTCTYDKKIGAAIN
jgi:hypothetical protein